MIDVVAGGGVDVGVHCYVMMNIGIILGVWPLTFWNY